MTIKDIKEAMDAKKAYIGVKQAIKHKKNIGAVFIAKDARDETVQKLEHANIEFIVLRPKSEIAKQLNLSFESEVFSVLK